MPIPDHIKRKMVRAPGASQTAVRASYGLPPVKKVDMRTVRRVCEHMARGLSLSAACGRAKVPVARMSDWIAEFPKVREAVGIAKLERLALLEEGLLKNDAKMPQIVARIFALKNADPTEWQENPKNGPSVPGLQQNITVITGVPEAPDPSKVIEHEPHKPQITVTYSETPPTPQSQHPQHVEAPVNGRASFE